MRNDKTSLTDIEDDRLDALHFDGSGHGKSMAHVKISTAEEENLGLRMGMGEFEWRMWRVRSRDWAICASSPPVSSSSHVRFARTTEINEFRKCVCVEKFFFLSSRVYAQRVFNAASELAMDVSTPTSLVTANYRAQILYNFPLLAKTIRFLILFCIQL